MATTFSAAGQALGFGTGADIPGAPQESEEEKRKRLAALQAAQARLGAGGANGSLSPAVMALGLGSGGF